MVLNKLIKDGFIVHENKKIRETNDIVYDYFEEISNAKYQLTFEGKVFIQRGGYLQQQISDDAEKIRVDNIETAQKGFRRIQNALLILVVVGTLVAAFYYLIEIGRYLDWWKK